MSSQAYPLVTAAGRQEAVAKHKVGLNCMTNTDVPPTPLLTPRGSVAAIFLWCTICNSKTDLATSAAPRMTQASRNLRPLKPSAPISVP